MREVSSLQSAVGINAVGSQQFGTPTKEENQSRIRRLADQDGSRQGVIMEQE